MNMNCNDINATNVAINVGASPPSLPKLYSTIDEVENDLFRPLIICPQKQKQQQPLQLQQLPSNDDDDDDDELHQNHDKHCSPLPFKEGYQSPHLFLHFDVNETILIGDPAGGDSVEECLNKIIAKSAFVSKKAVEVVDHGLNDAVSSTNNIEKNNDGNNVEALKRSPSSGNISDASSTHYLEPTHWWNGLPLHSTNNESDHDGETSIPPPPLYTGWTWPPQTCPYYRTNYKGFAKQFTNSSHGRMYRPLYEHLCLKLGLNRHQDTGEATTLEGEERDVFKNFLPAFFNALQHYFPSTSCSDSNSGNSNHSTSTTPSKNVPPPSQVTLVLRTFGTDLPRVAKCISEFAKGNHPSYPDYYNTDLILEESDLLCSGWTYLDKGNSGKKELIYELHPAANDSNKNTISGDEQVLNYLQSKSIVGIQDCYPFWRDQNHAPWAGKPVWARTTTADAACSRSQHNHHHILLDDNIHNDPNDGAGGIRIPNIDISDGNCTTTTMPKTPSYVSLHGNEALGMHGKHLIRVPTIRPLLEDDWFVRQIEEARWRLFVEEDERNQKSLNTSSGTLVLSNRNLSEDDFHQDTKLPLNLHSLDLSRNRLKCIPGQLFSFSGLTFLDVSRNSLKGFPPEISQLTQLVQLIALSNHFRLRQLPLEALASLKHLRMLDLRYNSKLKQSALTTLKDALQPNNPHLEIRCTVPLPTTLQHQDSNTKLSACDRDATLLQSQLEPLSTPQLCKRLERSFGVFLNKETEEAYDRELVMKTLLQCYAEHGPRQVRYEKGIPVTHDRLSALQLELEAIPWPTTTRERPKIQAEYYMILQKPGSGTPDSARTRKETAKLMKFKRLFDLAVETMGEVDSAFADCFTALAVTKNFGKSHIMV